LKNNNQKTKPMKKLLKSAVIFSLLFTIVANAQWNSKNRIKGNGVLKTEKRETGNYDEIKITGFFDVVLLSGQEGNITIDADENLLQYVKIEMKNGVLSVFTEKNSNISTNKKLLITIPFESLNAVSLVGSGNVTAKSKIKAKEFKATLSGSGNITLDIEADKTEALVSGSGDLILRGKSDQLTTTLSGSGDIDAANLKSDNVNATVAGSGDITVYCTNNLKALVAGSGDIFYKVNPKTKETKVNGSGSITQK
jgi:hypothetical protein